MNFRKRLIVLLLSLVMVLTYMPALAFAAEDGEAASDTAKTEETVNDEQPSEVPEAAEQNDGEEAADAAEKDGETAPEGVSVGAAASENDNDGAAADPEAKQDEETETETETVIMSGLSFSVDEVPEVDLDDSDELLMQYLEKQVNDEEPAPKPGLLKASRSTRGSKLTGNNATIYTKLVDHVKSIAGGECTTADSFTISVTSLDFQTGNSYTAADLQVDSLLTEENRLTDDAFYALLKVIGYDSDKVLSALLADLPYELYWYDKIAGTNTALSNIDLVEKNGVQALQIDEASLAVKFKVVPEYRSDAENMFSINADKVTAANTAAANARGIINKHSGEEVFECLDSYRQEILARNTYNHEAAATPEDVYGDPWQMIYVFDGDDTTNVVCEGYSKAFQFLIDNTTYLEKKGVECFSILGDMVLPGTNKGGVHMWNIVTLGDGKYYMADLTNCDDNSIGAPDLLFFKGCMAGGSPQTGYDFDIPVNGEKDGVSDLHYTYGETALSQYEQELVLSTEDYTPPTITGLEFIRNGSSTIRVQSGKDGYEDTESNFFRYGFDKDLAKMFVDGDILKITYSDSEQPVEFTYYTDSEEYGGQNRFVHDNGDDTYTWYSYDAFELSSNQNSAWEIGGTGYEFYITHVDTDKSVKAVCPVEVVKPTTGLTTKNVKITVEDDTYTYTGKPIKPAFTVVYTDGNVTLTEGKDYTVKYENNTDPGTAKVTVTGTGDYSGEVWFNFTIKKKTGTAPKGTVTITKVSPDLTKKTIGLVWDRSGVKGANHYQIIWKTYGSSKVESKFVGNTDRCTITGLKPGYLYQIRIRPYSASATATTAYGTWSRIYYRYFHAAENIKAVSKSKKTFTVSWKANPKATGYQIFYTTNKNGSGLTQNIKVAGKGATSLTIKNIKVKGKAQALKSGTTYYIRIRELKKAGGVNYAGNYSPLIAVKVK